MMLLLLMLFVGDQDVLWQDLIDARISRDSAALGDKFNTAHCSDLMMQEWLMTLGQSGNPREQKRLEPFLDHPTLGTTAVFAMGELEQASIDPLLALVGRREGPDAIILMEALAKLAPKDRWGEVWKAWHKLSDRDRADSVRYLWRIADEDGNRIAREALKKTSVPLSDGYVYYLFRGRAKITTAEKLALLDAFADYPTSLCYVLRIGVSDDGAPLIEPVRALCRHANWRVRNNAFQALVTLDPHAARGMGLAMLLDKNPGVVRTVIAALVEMKSDDLDENLVTATRSFSPSHLQTMFANVDDERLARFLPLLKGWPRVTSWQRVRAIGHMGLLGDREGLMKLWQVGDSIERANALPELARLEVDDLDRFLAQALRSGDPFQMATAVNLCAERGKLAIPRQEMTQFLDKRWGEVDFHYAWLDQLANLLSEDALAGERERLLSHVDYQVRLKALNSLDGPTQLQREAVFEGGWKHDVPPPIRALAVELITGKRPMSWLLDTSKGKVEIRLETGFAPITCANIAFLTEKGYFDGMALHRVVSNFVVQGGDPRGDGAGGPGHNIPCEVNMLRYHRGSVGMALAGKDTGGSQFFICHSEQPHLDGGYTVFGQVLSGMEVVDFLEEGDLILRATLR